MDQLQHHLSLLMASCAFAVAFEVVAGTKPQFYCVGTRPGSLFECCRKTASHAGETAPVSASCDPGNFPYAVAWYTLQMAARLPVVSGALDGHDASGRPGNPSEFRRLRGAFGPTFACQQHPVPGTGVLPRLAGKDGKRCDLLRSSPQHRATSFQAAARTIKYGILHLTTSEARLC